MCIPFLNLEKIVAAGIKDKEFRSIYLKRLNI